MTYKVVCLLCSFGWYKTCTKEKDTAFSIDRYRDRGRRRAHCWRVMNSHVGLRHHWIHRPRQIRPKTPPKREKKIFSVHTTDTNCSIGLINLRRISAYIIYAQNDISTRLPLSTLTYFMDMRSATTIATLSYSFSPFWMNKQTLKYAINVSNRISKHKNSITKPAAKTHRPQKNYMYELNENHG